MGITMGTVPEIGDVVKLPNGRQGIIEDASIKLIRSWFFNQVYYKVRWNGKKSRWYAYSSIVRIKENTLYDTNQ